MLLTQSTMPIIGWIATLLGFIMDFIFKILSSMGIQNIGLCIIIFTVFVRLLLLPLTIKQQRFTKISQAMQPEIKKIEKKYRNKKDQASMMKKNEETQALYEKYGISPTGGCLQLCIQLPILLAFYQVIRKIPAYIPQVKATYMTAVDAITQNTGYISKINEIADGLKTSYVSSLADDATANQVIDVLNYFTPDAWNKLADAFPSVSDTIQNVSSQVVHMNSFIFGIDVAQTPGFRLSIYLLIPILAAIFQYLSAKTMQQPGMDENNPAAGMNKSMTWMMPLMSLYFCIITPAGLGLYWVSAAMFQWIQQIAINYYFDHADMDKMIEKNREKAAKKKKKGKKSLMDRLMATSNNAEAAKKEYKEGNTSSKITSIAAMNLKKLPSSGSMSDADTANYDAVDIDQLGEIGKNAYLVSKYEKEHNTRGGKK